MKTCMLGNTGLNVSRACLGTMTFGGQTDEADARTMVDRCEEVGVNFIDTANVYQAGASETIVGRLLKGRRDRFVLASKCAGRMGPESDRVGLGRAAILRAADESLRRLQTDHLDLYYLHWPDYATPLDESLAAMDELVRSGRVRHVAASNYASWQVCRMLWIAESRRLAPVRVLQPMHNVLARGIEQELLPMAREFGLGTVVYNPLAGGLLTGKQSAEAPLPGTRFDGNQAYLERYWHEQNFQAVRELGSLAVAAGRSRVSVALNWLQHHAGVDAIILGASKVAHLEENLAAMGEGPLAADTVQGLDRLWSKLRGPVPRYNR